MAASESPASPARLSARVFSHNLFDGAHFGAFDGAHFGTFEGAQTGFV